MGVLDNKNDGGSGFVNIKTLQSVILQLRGTYTNFGCAIGWEYWDAGGTDGFFYPWQWVNAVAKAIFGKHTLPVPNLTAAATRPLAPFQNATDILADYGVDYAWAVWALNRTTGNLLEAEQLLVGAGKLTSVRANGSEVEGAHLRSANG
jgi:hypothetical protein